MRRFLKSPRDMMRGKTERSDEVKSFQNTCVFTVRLHLGHVDNAGTKLAGTFFFSVLGCDTSPGVPEQPLGLDLGFIWEAKIVSKPFRRPSGEVFDFGPRCFPPLGLRESGQLRSPGRYLPLI